MLENAIIESERQVVGITIRDPSAFDVADLMPTHFADKACRTVWLVLATLRDANLPIDEARFTREARRQGVVDDIGGLAGIANLVSKAGSAGSFQAYVDDVRRGHELRRLRSLADSLAASTCDPSADPATIRAQIDAELHTAVECVGVARSVSEIMKDVIRDMGSEDTRAGVPSGFPSYDGATAGGFHPGELIIIAARPSVGKSALAVGMGLHAALHRRRVLFVSLEMTSGDIALRVLASETGEKLPRLRAGKGDRQRAEEVAAEFDEVPFLLWSGRGVDLDQLRGVCRLEQARGGLDAIFVDYIGLVKPADRRKPRWEAVTETSNALKTLALTLNVPVIALCQLNRDAEGETPKLSHLRESGAIEQDADVVMLLDRERDSSTASLNVAKIRNGRTGPFDLHFDGAAFKFSEMPDDCGPVAPHEDFVEFAR